MFCILCDVAGANSYSKTPSGSCCSSQTSNIFGSPIPHHEGVLIQESKNQGSTLTWWRGEPKGKGETTLGLGLPCCWWGGWLPCLPLISSAISSTTSSFRHPFSTCFLGQLLPVWNGSFIIESSGQEETKAGFQFTQHSHLSPPSGKPPTWQQNHLGQICTDPLWRETRFAAAAAWRYSTHVGYWARGCAVGGWVHSG